MTGTTDETDKQRQQLIQHVEAVVRSAYVAGVIPEEVVPLVSIAVSLKRIADLMQERDDGHD